MSEHIIPRRVFYMVFAALLVGTGITVWVAFINLGFFNPVVALGIATVKALLVILFFMEVRYSARLTKIAIIGGFFWLVILIALTLSDYLTRLWPV